MYGVKFGNLHSWHDFQLLLTDKEIGTPAPKTALIDIPGGDGALDLTEAFGPVRYENRKLSFDFSTIVPMAQFMEQFAKIQNALHGQKMEIALDADPGWFYVGRVSVNTWKADRRVGKITIDCDCEPYKYRRQSQTITLTDEGIVVATFWNTRKSAVPTIYATGELTVESPSTFITLNPGENILPEFVFGPGNNTLTFKGQGVAVVEWKEGGL